MANKKNDTTVAKDGVLAVSLDAAFAAIVKEAAAKNNTSGAHIARVALKSHLESLGFKVPEIVESKKGPKSGVNTEAQKFGLTNAEYGRRMQALVKQGLTAKQILAYDFSKDPAPVKHREPKAAASGSTTA